MLPVVFAVFVARLSLAPGREPPKSQSQQQQQQHRKADGTATTVTKRRRPHEKHHDDCGESLEGLGKDVLFTDGYPDDDGRTMMATYSTTALTSMATSTSLTIGSSIPP